MMNKCYSCGADIQVVKNKPYHSNECGLDVVLHGITKYACPSCGEKYASVPNMPKLHRLIGMEICRKRKALLKAEEIKFLRSNCSQGTESFRKQADLRMTNTLRQPARKNLPESPAGRLPAPCKQLQLRGLSKLRRLPRE